MTSKSDLELVEEFKSGKVHGFNELVRRYQQKVYWIARRVLGTHEDADDVTQEVFARVYESLGKFRGDSSMYTWLYRIAANVSLNAVRRRKVRETVPIEHAETAIAAADDDPTDQLQLEEFRQALEAAVERLPPMQKMVFVMRYYEELPYEEMAKILKRSVGGLKANYFHALKKIQAFVKEELRDEV